VGALAFHRPANVVPHQLCLASLRREQVALPAPAGMRPEPA
jgi:hypothetical protein